MLEIDTPASFVFVRDIKLRQRSLQNLLAIGMNAAIADAAQSSSFGRESGPFVRARRIVMTFSTAGLVYRRAQALTFTILACTMLAIGACNPVQVRTVVAPGADFSGRRTFHVMAQPKVKAGAQLPANDPMLVNSITNRRIRSAIRAAFEKRGYQYVEDSADLDVAYYATAMQQLDVRSFDYGYGWRRFWPREQTEVYQYEEGTVIIDVVDPATRQLLWRGQGKAQVSTDPEKYAAELEKAVDAIVAKFPAPGSKVATP
jgi:hypothetical protein